MILIAFLGLVLDLVIIYISGYTLGDISYLYPMLTLSSIVILSTKLKPKTFLYTVLLIGVIVGTIFFDNALMGLVIYVVIYYFLFLYNKLVSSSILSFLVKLAITIFLYDMTSYFILVLFDHLYFNLSYLFYKFIRSLILNIFYGIILYLVLNEDKP